MKLKMIFSVALILLVHNTYSICYTNRNEATFISELYLGNNDWFIELNKGAKDLNFLSSSPDSMAISCKSGTSMVKQSALDTTLNKNKYLVLNSDSLTTPLQFDKSQDTIRLIYYWEDYKSEFMVVYGDDLESWTKAPADTQSVIYSSYNCHRNGYITNQPTPGSDNILKVGESEIARSGETFICNPIQNGKALRISVDASFDQKSSLIAIYNMSGDEVFLKFLIGEPSFDIDTESFPAGMYIVALKNNNGTVTTKAFSVL